MKAIVETAIVTNFPGLRADRCLEGKLHLRVRCWRCREMVPRFEKLKRNGFLRGYRSQSTECAGEGCSRVLWVGTIYCKEARVNDYDTLFESFNLQFDTDRTLDSIDQLLTINSIDEDLFVLSQDAERYRKWYTGHPVKVGRTGISAVG